MQTAERTDDRADTTLVRRVRVWALGRGLAVVPGAVDLIIAAKRERDGEGHAEHLHRWTVRDVEELVWIGVVRSCQALGTPLPPEATETLWCYLGYLGEHGLLATGSDPLPALLLPLQTYGGLNRFGRRRPAGSSRPSRRRASAGAVRTAEAGSAVILPFRRPVQA